MSLTQVSSVKRYLRISFIILFFLLKNGCCAQLKGIIKDKKTGKPLEFVNIGIVGKNIGTVCDEKGEFTLNTNLAGENDTIKIFQLGYAIVKERLKNFVAQHEKDPVIYLQQKSVLLRETVVKPKKVIQKIIGNLDNSEAVVMYFQGTQLGAEVGVRMHIKNRQSQLEELRFNIAKIFSVDSTVFRVNIYSIKNDLPDSLILPRPFYVTYKNNSGPLLVNVTDLHLYVQDDVFVSLEWIKGIHQPDLRFCAGLINTHSLIRVTSQGTWQKSPVGAGFSCKISCFK